MKILVTRGLLISQRAFQENRAAKLYVISSLHVSSFEQIENLILRHDKYMLLQLKLF